MSEVFSLRSSKSLFQGSEQREKKWFLVFQEEKGRGNIIIPCASRIFFLFIVLSVFINLVFVLVIFALVSSSSV